MQELQARPVDTAGPVATAEGRPLTATLVKLPHVFDKLCDQLIATMSLYLPAADLLLIRPAYTWAYTAHLGQQRASGEPFFDHPLHVARLLVKLRLDSSTIAAALLHDVVEDTEMTLEQIRSIFGNDIADLVDGVTKPRPIGGHSCDQAQLAAHRKLAARIRRDPRVGWIKLADRLHNLCTLHALAPDRQRRIVRETNQFYVPLAREMKLFHFVAAMEDFTRNRLVH